MNASNWLSSKLNLLRNSAPASVPPEEITRSTRERLDATVRKQKEALSPRSLRRTLSVLQSVVDPKVSEVEGGRRAMALADWYAKAEISERQDLWLLISEQFGPDPTKVRAARDEYDAALGTVDEGAAEIRLRRALVSPRTRLLQRFAAYPGGMRFLVDLRAEMLPHIKGNKRLLALDAELENLFSTWFDVAFLELRTISWDSPASLIEKLIKYEAVHDIRSWADLKNRLDSDRRCYGFFHPSLPNEPLIFVEVALLHEMADNIMPKLVARTQALKVLHGENLAAEMGPIVTQQAHERISGYIAQGVSEGAQLLVDGRGFQGAQAGAGCENGFWMGGSLFDHVTTDMRVYTDEIFGPVLCVVRVETYEEAVRLIAENPYGNGVAIFTRDGGAGRRFAHEVDAGMVGINVPIPVPMAYYSFGGWKASLFGDLHVHGVEGVKFYTRTKVVTSRWPDPGTSSVDLGFPQVR